MLLAVALPLLIGGGTRLNASWNDWRHERSVGRDWIRGTGTVTAVRESDGLALRLFYFDRSGERHDAQVQVEAIRRRSGSTAGCRSGTTRSHTGQVDLVDVAEARPLGSALVAGAAIGAGLAALILAFGDLAPPTRARGRPTTPSRCCGSRSRSRGSCSRSGSAAWAVGTVSLRGWSGVADRLGNQFSVVFGDMLGVVAAARDVRDRLPAHRVARPPPSSRGPRRACSRTCTASSTAPRATSRRRRTSRPRRCPGPLRRSRRADPQPTARRGHGAGSRSSPSARAGRDDQNRAMTSSAKRASESSWTCRSFGSPP